MFFIMLLDPFLDYLPIGNQPIIALWVLFTLSFFDHDRILLPMYGCASFFAWAYRCSRMRLPWVGAARVALRLGKYFQPDYQEAEYICWFGKDTESHRESPFSHLKSRKTKRAALLQNSFLGMAATTVVAPLIASALPNIPVSDWSFTAAISHTHIASSRSSSASSIQVFSGKSKVFWGLVKAQGVKLLLFLINTVIASVIMGISHWIYSTFCYSRLRTYDQPRKRGFLCMLLYLGTYYHIRDDPNLQRGVSLRYVFLLHDL